VNLPTIGLAANLNNEDDDGLNWTLLRNAADPSVIVEGAVLKAGTEGFWSWVRIRRVGGKSADGCGHVECPSKGRSSSTRTARCERRNGAAPTKPTPSATVEGQGLGVRGGNSRDAVSRPCIPDGSWARRAFRRLELSSQAVSRRQMLDRAACRRPCQSGGHSHLRRCESEDRRRCACRSAAQPGSSRGRCLGQTPGRPRLQRGTAPAGALSSPDVPAAASQPGLTAPLPSQTARSRPLTAGPWPAAASR
jgi:hypothetical protein